MLEPADSTTEKVFGSAIDVLAILIAVAGLVAAAQKAVVLDYLESPLKLLLIFIGALSVGSAATAMLALARLRGARWVSAATVVRAMCSLIICTCVATVWFIWVV